MKTVHCAKLNDTLEGLAKPPLPGALGQRIFETISDAAWKLWLKRQTILINEYRLNLTDKQARSFLREQAEAFLFGEGGDIPDAFTPPTDTAE